jgi:glutamate dehydrogenase (NAD(P)+)
MGAGFQQFFLVEEINVCLDRIITNALAHIWSAADKHQISLRTATYAVACERILMARAERGLYP